MRALFVHASTDLYGSDLACLWVAEEAIERGWEVEVTVPGEGPLVGRLEELGATLHRVDPLKPRRRDLRPENLPGSALTWIRNLGALARLAREIEADVVYTTTAPTLGGFLPARRWKSAHVYHVHELFWDAKRVLRAFERVLARADVVLCCSSSVADQFTHTQLRDRLVVAPTGIRFPTVPTDTPMARTPTRVICVARLNEWKGQEILIDAAARLHREGRPLQVDLVGDVYADEHHFRHRLSEQITSLGLSGIVNLLGERRDATELVAAADVFVLPSRRAEPFGMALVEAMALGRPVVATDAGGPSEIVTNGVDGLLVPPGDAGALAAAIRDLLDDPARALRLGEHARTRAADFPAAAMATTVVDVFETLVGR